MPVRRRPSIGAQQTVVPSAARTTSGSSSTLTGWARLGSAVANPMSKLTITAASGTSPSLVVTIEDSPNGVGWTVRDTFPAQTGTGQVTRVIPAGLHPFQRVSWTITGTTPSFTFNVQFASSTDTLV